MQIEGISADEGGGESRDGVVDIGRGHERIARGRIDVAPSLAAIVRRDAHEHAALHGGRSVHTVNGALERHLDEDRRDVEDAHGVPSIYRDWHEPAPRCRVALDHDALRPAAADQPARHPHRLEEPPATS
jgi:hypothetical protein